MKNKLLIVIKDSVGFACGLAVLRIYLFGQEATYSLLEQSLLGGLLWGIVIYRYVKFKEPIKEKLP